eukprot:135668-Pelagomonas_calceolata.AAC.6
MLAGNTRGSLLQGHTVSVLSSEAHHSCVCFKWREAVCALHGRRLVLLYSTKVHAGELQMAAKKEKPGELRMTIREVSYKVAAKRRLLVCCGLCPRSCATACTESAVLHICNEPIHNGDE